MDKLLTFEEIKAQKMDGYYYAVLEDGREVNVTYISDFGGVLFCDVCRDRIVGFKLIRRFGERLQRGS